MGIFKDLINNFIEPKPEEKSFKVLCEEVGLSEEATNALNEARKGINWAKFAREDDGEENKKKVRKFSTSRIQTTPEVSKESSRKEGRDRE